MLPFIDVPASAHRCVAADLAHRGWAVVSADPGQPGVVELCAWRAGVQIRLLVQASMHPAPVPDAARADLAISRARAARDHADLWIAQVQFLPNGQVAFGPNYVRAPGGTGAFAASPFVSPVWSAPEHHSQG